MVFVTLPRQLTVAEQNTAKQPLWSKIEQFISVGFEPEFIQYLNCKPICTTAVCELCSQLDSRGVTLHYILVYMQTRTHTYTRKYILTCTYACYFSHVIYLLKVIFVLGDKAARLLGCKNSLSDQSFTAFHAVTFIPIQSNWIQLYMII